MKKISKHAMRSKTVNSILASLRMEQLTPSEEVVKGMRAWAVGEETTENILNGVMRRHVTLRRGR